MTGNDILRRLASLELHTFQSRGARMLCQRRLTWRHLLRSQGQNFYLPPSQMSGPKAFPSQRGTLNPTSTSYRRADSLEQGLLDLEWESGWKCIFAFAPTYSATHISLHLRGPSLVVPASRTIALCSIANDPVNTSTPSYIIYQDGQNDALFFCTAPLTQLFS